MEKRKDGFLIEKGAHEKDFIFGTRAVMESIQAGKDIDKVLVQKELNNDLIKELLQLCKAEKIPVVRVPDAKLNRITRKNHQGVVAQMSAIEYASLDHVIESCFAVGKSPLILILSNWIQLLQYLQIYLKNIKNGRITFMLYLNIVLP